MKDSIKNHAERPTKLIELESLVQIVCGADFGRIQKAFDGVPEVNSVYGGDTLLSLLFNHLPENRRDDPMAMELMRGLTRRDVNLNQSGLPGVTPLTLCIDSGFFNATQFLIEAGADINVVDSCGLSPLSRVFRHPFAHKRVEIVCLLLDHGVDLAAYRVENDRSLLSTCVNEADPDLLRQLLARGHDPRGIEHRVGNALDLSIFENATTTARPGSKRHRDLNECQSILTTWFECQAARDAVDEVASMARTAPKKVP